MALHSKNLLDFPVNLKTALSRGVISYKNQTDRDHVESFTCVNKEFLKESSHFVSMTTKGVSSLLDLK